MCPRKQDFSPNCLPTLIGSLPVADHGEALEMIREAVPEIPLWAQLPVHPEEGMVNQFVPGLPGLTRTENRTYLDTGSDTFEEEYLAFFEEYLAMCEDGADLSASRFALSEENAPGFFTLLDNLTDWPGGLAAVKGQVSGPFSLATAVRDQNGRDALYDDRLRDAVVKKVALCARWQVRMLRKAGVPVLMFLDEPALAGFGTSAYITVTKDDATALLAEPMEAVAEEGGLVGVHICANSDWSLVLDSAADVVSFDAYSFFDKFLLFEKEIRGFLGRGGIVAWGIVPTAEAEHVHRESVASLTALWEKQAESLAAIGVDMDTIRRQTLITPACGTGSLDVPTARRVLEMTRGVSRAVRGLTD